MGWVWTGKLRKRNILGESSGMQRERGRRAKRNKMSQSEVTLHFQITNSYKPMKEAESKFSAEAKPNAMSLESSSPSNPGYGWEDDMEKVDEQLQISLFPRPSSSLSQSCFNSSFLSPCVIMRTWGLNVQRAFWAPTGNSIIELYKQGAFKVLNPKKFNNIHKHRFKWKTWKAKNVCYINTALVDCNKVLI